MGGAVLAGDTDDGGGDRFEGARWFDAAVDDGHLGHGGGERFEAEGKLEVAFGGVFSEGWDFDGEELDGDVGPREQRCERGADGGGVGAAIGESDDTDWCTFGLDVAGADGEDGDGGRADDFAEAAEAGALAGIDGEQARTGSDGEANGRRPWRFAVEAECEAGGLDARREGRSEGLGCGPPGGFDVCRACGVGLFGCIEEEGGCERQAKGAGERGCCGGEGGDVGGRWNAKYGHGVSMPAGMPWGDGRPDGRVADLRANW